MAQNIVLPWNNDSLTIALPDTWRVLAAVEPRTIPAAPDPAVACAESLQSPVGTLPLSQRDLSNKRIALIVDDHTRPTPVRTFIGPVLDELGRAGVTDERIDIIIAAGVHRRSTPEEVERKLGREVLSRFTPVCHDAYDMEGLSDLGTTSRGTRVFVNRRLPLADLIVCVGAVEPHLLLGFGGGLKMIVPGCAGAQTIGTNHMQGVDPEHFDYVGVKGSHSPMGLDLEEAARLLGKEMFLVNVAMSQDTRPAQFFCGDPIAAHRAGEVFVEQQYRIDLPEQADAVIANSYPLDVDLRQSLKCVGNSLYACKPGGVMLGCVRCETGLGEMPIPKKTLPYPVLRALLKLVGKQGVLPLVKQIKKNEPVEEIFVGHFGLQALRRNHLGLFSDSPALPPEIGKKLGMARSFTLTQDMIHWAQAKLPKRPTIWVFPKGGATYARHG
jgi:nickel-dependent lactate racemase